MTAQRKKRGEAPAGRRLALKAAHRAAGLGGRATLAPPACASPSLQLPGFASACCARRGFFQKGSGCDVQGKITTQPRRGEKGHGIGAPTA